MFLIICVFGISMLHFSFSVCLASVGYVSHSLCVFDISGLCFSFSVCLTSVGYVSHSLCV